MKKRTHPKEFQFHGFEPSLVSQVSKADRASFRGALDELVRERPDGRHPDRDFIVVRLAMRMTREFLPSDRWETLGRWELREAPGTDLRKQQEKVRTGHYSNAGDFERIRQRAIKLLRDIRMLRSTLLIRRLVDMEAIRPGDLLHTSTSFDCFDALLSLKRWVKKHIGPPSRTKLDENELLDEIVGHIHGSTGEWRDGALATVHYYLGLPHPTEDDMKTWRATRRKKQTAG